MEPPDLKILSAGAPRIGVTQCVDAFARAEGRTVDIRFATAPVLREDVESGHGDADVIIAPVPVQEAFESAGRTVPGTAVRVGSIHAGVVVPADAPDPDISSADGLVQALRDADQVVYNVASSGQYIEQMIDRLGLAADLAAKIVRTPTGAAVLEAVAAGAGKKVVGFGQTTEISRHEHLGVRLVGPLPDPLGKVTTYAAALSADAAAPELARYFLRYLGREDAWRLLVAAGIE